VTKQNKCCCTKIITHKENDFFLPCFLLVAEALVANNNDHDSNQLLLLLVSLVNEWSRSFHVPATSHSKFSMLSSTGRIFGVTKKIPWFIRKITILTSDFCSRFFHWLSAKDKGSAARTSHLYRYSVGLIHETIVILSVCLPNRRRWVRILYGVPCCRFCTLLCGRLWQQKQKQIEQQWQHRSCCCSKQASKLAPWCQNAK